MRYSKDTCVTTVSLENLADDLYGAETKEEFKKMLANSIGGWCAFGSDCHFGREFLKEESAAKGKQCFKWEKHDDEITFTATLIGEDYEDEINWAFYPFFELTDADYEAIKTCIEEYKAETDSEPGFVEIEKVKEIHTYKLQDDWFLEIRLEHEVNESNGKELDSWMGYIYRKGYSPMFVIGECLDQCTLYSNWQPYKVTLKEFELTMYETLYDDEATETPFEEYDRQIELIEQDNLRIIEEMNA